MTIHPDVLRRGTNRANSLTLAIRGSRFMAVRYTGNVLEQAYLLTPELTDQGLREAEFMFPPLIALNQLFEQIDNHPISGPMLHAMLDPIITTLASLDSGLFVLDQNELSRRRVKETNDMSDALNLNRARRSNANSINIIYPTI